MYIHVYTYTYTYSEFAQASPAWGAHLYVYVCIYICIHTYIHLSHKLHTSYSHCSGLSCREGTDLVQGGVEA